MIEELNIKIRKSSGSGVFHDSRSDCRILARTCNELIEKVNELIIKVNELEGKY